MKKFFMWAGMGVGVLVGLMIIGSVAIYFKSQARLTRTYDLPEEVVSIPADAESIQHGRHIFQFRGCEACHSGRGYLDVSDAESSVDSHLSLPSQDIPHMEGHIYLDDPAIGKVVASNLTSGEGGVGSEYKDQDWVRAIRHGIRPNKTPLLFMPSTEFYIRSAPPVDNELPSSTLSWTGRVAMTLVPAITFIPAELIPRAGPRPAVPEVGITPEYGEYLTHSCKVCHGLRMSGGLIPGFPSGWPPAPNLTFGDGSALPAWTEAGFRNTIRSGVTPEGIKLRPEYMPWGSYKFMSDEELQAVWVYLQSLPKLEYGNR
jgi:mono/diheme cytochrome c family protein